MKKKHYKLLPAFLWLIFTIVLLILPGSAFPEETPLPELPIDKLIHIVLFFLLVWFFCRGMGLKNNNLSKTQKNGFLIFIAASLLGLLLEFVQKEYIPNRAFEIADVYADTAGAFFGFLFCMAIAKKN